MRKIGKKTASLLVALGFLVVGSSMIFMSYWNNTEGTEKRIVEEIEQSDAPLLRYWRWPDKARSAMSVTGDIDSVTLSDFVLRILENLHQCIRNR